PHRAASARSRGRQDPASSAQWAAAPGHRQTLTGEVAMSFLTIERVGGIVTLTMSEPATRNAITDNSAVDEFAAACAEINGNVADKVVIITGAGSVFSSGGNISTMHRCMDPAMSCEAIITDYQAGIQRLPLLLTALDV